MQQSEIRSKIDSIKLREPFPIENLEWRVQQCGARGDKIWAIVLPYIQARAVMDRLDHVFGVYGWDTKLNVISSGTYMGLSCVITAHGHVCREDVSEFTPVEPLKGAASGAIKRAAVHFGIGRYLYDIDGVLFANITDNGTHKGKTKDGKEFRWNPPSLPEFCHPRDNIDVALDIVTAGTIRVEKTGMLVLVLNIFNIDVPVDTSLITIENVSRKLKKILTNNERDDIITVCEDIRLNKTTKEQEKEND
jgi:hypothetical protein